MPRPLDTEGEREPEDPWTKEPTHRLCKGVVPEDSGCRIVVLAAVNNHHHWERQGLEDRVGHIIGHFRPVLFCLVS